jgi:hypothetical protein
LLRFGIAFALTLMFSGKGFSKAGLLAALGGSAEETTEASDAEGFAETLQQAVENGVSVVVVDSNGNLLAQSEKVDENTGAELVENDSALLMKL